MCVFRKLLVLLLLWVYGQSAVAGDCSSYSGTPVVLAKDTADMIGKALKAIKTKNRVGLSSISGNQLLLLRRSVSGGAQGRIGNVRLPLWPRDIDSNFNIHIGNQTFADFADGTVFDSISTDKAIAVQREVCEDARSCDDQLPASDEVPFMLKDLLECNQSGQGVFVFTDGVWVIDMRLASGKVPVGAALFFAQGTKGYRLAALIVQG